MRSSFPNGGSASADLPKGRPALADASAAGQFQLGDLPVEIGLRIGPGGIDILHPEQDALAGIEHRPIEECALGIILDVKAAGGRLQLEETVTDMHPIVFSRIPIGVRSGGAFEFGTAINIHADFTDEFLGRAITDNQF